MQKGYTYSGGFFLFSASPSIAHSKWDTSGLGVVSTTPRSISCGPRLESLAGMTSLKRERNITMNCRSRSARQSSGVKRAQDAPFRVKTYGNVGVIS